MKTKHFLLGLGEGIIVAFLFPLVLYIKNHAPEAIGIELPLNFMLILTTGLVFSVVLLITNNVRKFVFVEVATQKREIVIECLGGILSLITTTVLLLSFS